MSGVKKSQSPSPGASPGAPPGAPKGPVARVARVARVAPPSYEMSVPSAPFHPNSSFSHGNGVISQQPLASSTATSIFPVPYTIPVPAAPMYYHQQSATAPQQPAQLAQPVNIEIKPEFNNYGGGRGGSCHMIDPDQIYKKNWRQSLCGCCNSPCTCNILYFLLLAIDKQINLHFNDFFNVHTIL